MTALRDQEVRRVAPIIFRQVSFSLPGFDLLKAWQRQLERTEGRTLTNSEVLDRLILSNPLP